MPFTMQNKKNDKEKPKQTPREMARMVKIRAESRVLLSTPHTLKVLQTNTVNRLMVTN